MRLLYTTADRSFWERARLELHAEGIETFESDVDPALTTLGSPLMQREYRLYILRDEDYPQANEVLLRIGGAPTERLRLPQGAWLKLALLGIGLAIAAVALL
jgi:hypothetical protein